MKERIKRNIKENKVPLIIFSVIWATLIIITLSFYANTLGKESIGSRALNDIVEIDKDTSIHQEIMLEKGTDLISIKYATYARKNNGTLKLTIIGKDTKNVYLEENKKISLTQDNAFVTYNLAKPLEKDEVVEIDISADSENGSSIGIYFTNEEYFENCKLEINNEKSDLQLGLRILSDNIVYKSFSNIIIISSIVLFTLVIVLLVLVNPKKEIIFTAMAATFGVIYLFLISPGAVPDETLHYEQVLQLSSICMGEDHSHIDKAYTNYDSFADHINDANSYNRLLRDFNKPLKLKNENYTFNTKIDNTYFGYYVPQTIGVLIARLLSLNMIKTFYFGRLTNLIFYCACVYFAIKNTPIKKMLLGVIACLPIIIQQAASFSYDTYINGLTLVFISYLFKWLYSDSKVSRKDFILTLIFSILLTPAKVVYSLFSFLFFLVPVDKFENKKQRILYSTLICIPSFLFVGYNVLLRTTSVFDNLIYDSSRNLLMVGNSNLILSDDGDKFYTISYILKHPTDTFILVVKSIRFYISTWFYQSIGRSLAGSNLVLPMNLVRIVIACVLCVSLREESYVESIPLKVTSLLICVASGMLVLMSMLTGWTHRNSELVQGMQGRYFCPLLPYFFSTLGNKKLKISKKTDIYVCFTLICITLFTVIYVLSYTFVN